MAETFEITDEMRAEIGVESEPWPYEVTTTGIRAFARGVGYEDPVYYDAEAARQEGYRRLPAPPCYLGTPVFLPGRSDAVFSGPPGTGPRPRYGLEHVLDGGTEVVYERPVAAGETLMATNRLVDLQVKRSGSLGTMLVVSSEATFRDRRGEVAARERSRYIFY
jgi:acyl dehydratase